MSDDTDGTLLAYHAVEGWKVQVFLTDEAIERLRAGGAAYVEVVDDEEQPSADTDDRGEWSGVRQVTVQRGQGS